MDVTIKKPFLILKKSTLIRHVFYVVLFFVAFISNDPSRTIVLSTSRGIYIPIGSAIFLSGGIIITILDFKKLFSMPKVLVVAGPVFAAYVLVQTAIRVVAGATYSVQDTFYTVVELMNIILSIGMGYCYVQSLKRKDVFVLQPICYTILAILILYYTAIFASQVVLPIVKSLTGMSVAVDSLRHGVDIRLGFRRLYGPLANSTSLGLILIPICGYSLFLLRIRPKARDLITFVVASTLTMLTGSRIAIFGYIVLLVYWILNRYRWSAVLMSILFGFFLLAVWDSVSLSLPQKLHPLKAENYIDVRRLAALSTCCRAWLSTPASFFWGVGYNDILLVTKKQFLCAAGLMKHHDIISEYGFLPGGPHSMFNWAISGTGLIGVLLRCSFVYGFLFHIICKIKRHLHQSYSVFIAAVCISFINLFTNESHLSSPMLMACWFAFYVFAYKLIRNPQRLVHPQPMKRRIRLKTKKDSFCTGIDKKSST